ncbi:MAG: hypothetical protein ACRYHA_19790 [Janthinobacterium lividum]
MKTGFDVTGVAIRVTGASSGIGRTIATRLAEAGAQVGVDARLAYCASKTALDAITRVISGVSLPIDGGFTAH